MSTTYKRLLNRLSSIRVRPGWYTVIIKEAFQNMRDMILYRSGVRDGGVASKGTIAADSLGLNVTAVDTTLNGNLKAQLAALVDADVMTKAGVVEEPIFEDGAEAETYMTGTGLQAGETAYVTLIAMDGDGAGAATGDNGAALYLAVIAGTQTTYMSAAAFLTDAEIETALAASTGVHDGITGWVRLADVLWDEGGGAPDATVTVNRDA